MTKEIRELRQVSSGIQSMDGDGVKLTRLIGSNELDMLDPFLLLDSFESDKPSDYVGGFPSHPHRGFETVTYMLNGKMRHQDNLGNEGVIEPNGVQWMTAGKGVIHSEMPEQTAGKLHGLQLWVNLPQRHKMTSPAYQEYSDEQILTESVSNNGKVNVVAGVTDAGTKGRVDNRFVKPTYLDVHLHHKQSFTQTLPATDNAFIYMISGAISIGIAANNLEKGQLGILTKGTRVSTLATQNKTRFILVSGKPINEPVVRAGPFVMNTQTELAQAFQDYRNNRF